MLFSFTFLIFFAFIKSSLQSTSSQSPSKNPSAQTSNIQDFLDYFGFSPIQETKKIPSIRKSPKIEEVFISIDQQNYFSSSSKLCIMKLSSSGSLAYHFSKQKSKELFSSQNMKLTGQIVDIEPRNACSSVVLKSNYISNSSIVPLVISDGSCSLQEQVKNILKLPYSLGAILILTENHLSGIFEVDFPTTSSSTTIPAIFSLSLDSSKILYYYLGETPQLSSYLSLSHRAKFTDTSHSNSLSSLISDTEINGEVVVLFVLLVIIFCLFISIIFQWKQLRRQQRLANQRRLQQRQIVVVDKAFISKLPLRIFGESVTDHTVINIAISQEQPSYDTCPICLDDFVSGDILRELPCGHDYHQDCIHPWLEQRSVLCPMCKVDVRDTFVNCDDTSSDSDSETNGASGGGSNGGGGGAIFFLKSFFKKMQKFWKKITKKLLRFLINESNTPSSSSSSPPTIVHRSPPNNNVNSTMMTGVSNINTQRSQTEYSLPTIM